MSTRFAFQIPIGDWSGDGHSECDWFTATATKPIEAVRDAFFAAAEKLPDVNPVSFCYWYLDPKVPTSVRTKLQQLGHDIDPDDFGTTEMALLVVWYLNQGDPELDVQLDDSADLPMLPFYGFDRQGRHIGSLGYGLFSD